TGVIQMWSGASAPNSDWLVCDGAAYSRSVYSALFAVVGTTYGAGDGSTTFNVPDVRGRVAAGYAASGGHSDVATLGLNDGSALANRRPKHNHPNSLTLPDHVHGQNNQNWILTPDEQAGGANQWTLTFGPDLNIDTGASIAITNPTTHPAINGTI